MRKFLHLLIILYFVYHYSCIRTTKEKDLFCLDGYEYRKKGTSADLITQFWACTRKNCNGRAHSPIGTEELHHVGEHNHMPANANHEVEFSTVNHEIKIIITI